MARIKVEGENRSHGVFIYALSTCGWCKKTKQFLRDNGIEYEYLDVDTATSEERRAAIKHLQERKVPLGFPVTIVDDETIISGYDPGAIKEALGL
ncbi:MAG: glutaredoxin family protein [Candidatus Bathyarchaeota archaeon]|nr:glutaredoxin family protein [Candidatus Bathyarchaeota archaeon]MCW3992145.1 glutaredoxin family protein [Candidatus Bathyarchaeota archaeon]